MSSVTMISQQIVCKQLHKNHHYSRPPSVVVPLTSSHRRAWLQRVLYRMQWTPLLLANVVFVVYVLILHKQRFPEDRDLVILRNSIPSTQYH
ncbi:hypothetical protein TNCT_532381 [Trichonephila clavata]|uniref:Uncharacterized protein n=1 Tax=Trichonephila clavata TaxID=2740835 RepID=A0A8X6KD19_TRICU|nr:hypothetical protein TNCT_532381 [Trichonephila clavata]